MTDLTPIFDRAAVLQRSPEEIRADLNAQTEAAQRLSPLVRDSVAYAYYQNAVNQNPPTSDSFFWQGRFSEAADCADGQNKQEYLEFVGAMVNLDMPMCDCPPMQIPNGVDAKGSLVPSKREVQRVYVANSQKEIKFVCCDKCGKLFAESV